jgi:hypothetical protein
MEHNNNLVPFSQGPMTNPDQEASNSWVVDMELDSPLTLFQKLFLVLPLPRSGEEGITPPLLMTRFVEVPDLGMKLIMITFS